MENLSLSVNLLRLPKAVMHTINGVTCVVLPVELNDIYVSNDMAGQPKAAYLNMSVWANRTPSQYGDTHYIKQSHSREYRERLAAEGKKEAIIGNGRPIAKQQSQEQSAQAPAPQPAPQQINWDTDQIPF